MEILQAFHDGYFWVFASVIIPMGLVSVVISLQNIESAEAAGDSYPTRPSLMVNGLGTIGAAFFGSCFPTTIYIGHPGWKATGARAGYSTLTALMMTAICLSGSLLYIVWAIPVDAGMAILLWIGVFVTAQAFTAVPAAHAPAVVLGILPGVAAWGTQLIKNALRVAGYGSAGGPEFSEKLFVLFQSSDIWVHGAFALEQGYIYTSMIFAATTVCLVEKKFNQAAVWCLVATALCLTGFMHSYKFVPGDSVGLLRPGLSWASGYFTMAVTFFLAKYVTEDGSAH
jgi:AGZA family xanthine/uracil permease-like MFS transporter